MPYATLDSLLDHANVLLDQANVLPLRQPARRVRFGLARVRRAWRRGVGRRAPPSQIYAHLRRGEELADPLSGTGVYWVGL